jgi:hypothetical protein
VNARVTDRVICVFHAPVTLPRWRKRLKLFEIVDPSTITEASKTENVRKNFVPELQETVVSVFMVESPASPLYLLRNIQTGKSKKKLELSLAAAQTGIEVSAIAPYLFKEHPDGKK